MIAFFIGTNDPKSVSSREEIANEFFSLTLSVKKKFILRGNRFSKKVTGVNES